MAENWDPFQFPGCPHRGRPTISPPLVPPHGALSLQPVTTTATTLPCPICYPHQDPDNNPLPPPLVPCPRNWGPLQNHPLPGPPNLLPSSRQRPTAELGPHQLPGVQWYIDQQFAQYNARLSELESQILSMWGQITATMIEVDLLRVPDSIGHIRRDGFDGSWVEEVNSSLDNNGGGGGGGGGATETGEGERDSPNAPNRA